MNRKELYAKVKELHLEDQIKKWYNDNYTRVSSANLEAAIAKAQMQTAVAHKETVATTKKKVVASGAIVEGPAHSVGDRLIEVLKKKHILLQSEIDYIYS